MWRNASVGLAFVAVGVLAGCDDGSREEGSGGATTNRGSAPDSGSDVGAVASSSQSTGATASAGVASADDSEPPQSGGGNASATSPGSAHENADDLGSGDDGDEAVTPSDEPIDVADAAPPDMPGAAESVEVDAAAGTNEAGGSDVMGSELDAGSGELSPLLDSIPPGGYGTAADLLEANSEMAVAAVGTKIYVVGGYPASRETQDTVQVYDTISDSWDLAQSLPEPIHHPVLVGVDGRLYSLGGQPNTARSLVYDPQLDEWSDIAPMPTARGAGAGAAIGDRIFVVGGRSPAQNEFEAYDISDDEWTTLPNLPRDYDTRNHLAAAAIGDKIYVAGGRYDGDGFNSPMTDALDVFDTATSEWTRLAAMLLPRGGVNGVAVNGCFHVWGGEGTNTGYPNDVFPNHDVYNPITDEWLALPDLPIPVHGVTGAALISGLIYIPGGGTSSGGSSGSTHFQVYRPELDCTQ